MELQASTSPRGHAAAAARYWAQRPGDLTYAQWFSLGEQSALHLLQAAEGHSDEPPNSGAQPQGAEGEGEALHYRLDTPRSSEDGEGLALALMPAQEWSPRLCQPDQGAGAPAHLEGLLTRPGLWVHPCAYVDVRLAQPKDAPAEAQVRPAHPGPSRPPGTFGPQEEEERAPDQAPEAMPPDHQGPGPQAHAWEAFAEWAHGPAAPIRGTFSDGEPWPSDLHWVPDKVFHHLAAWPEGTRATVFGKLRGAKAGDWICGGCGYHVHARRMSCAWCQAGKGEALWCLPLDPGDALCPCGQVIKPRFRGFCRACNRPVQAAQAQGAQGPHDHGRAPQQPGPRAQRPGPEWEAHGWPLDQRALQEAVHDAGPIFGWLEAVLNPLGPPRLRDGWPDLPPLIGPLPHRRAVEQARLPVLYNGRRGPGLGGGSPVVLRDPHGPPAPGPARRPGPAGGRDAGLLPLEDPWPGPAHGCGSHARLGRGRHQVGRPSA